MSQYKKILIGYLNQNKNGKGRYLAITNVSDEDILIKPSEKLYLNETPSHVLEQYPKLPQFTKDIRIEEDQVNEEKDISDDIPF